MLTQADDDGRLVADARQLRLVAFGYHERVAVKHVDAALLEIAKAGLIRLYSNGGIEYADFPSWHDHQTVDRYVPSVLPSADDSASIRRTFDDDSASIRSTPSDSHSDLRRALQDLSSTETEGRKEGDARGRKETTNGFATWPGEWEPIKRQIHALPFLSKYAKWLDDIDWWKTLDEWFTSCPKPLDALLLDATTYITSEGYVPRTRRALLQKLRNCMHTAGRIAEREAQRGKPRA